MSYFQCTGTALPLFHSDENSLFTIQDLKIIFVGLHNELPQVLIKQILILSGPCALFGFKFWVIFKISYWERLMNVIDWSVRGAKLFGSLLLLCNIERCSAKQDLKSSYFRQKSVIKWSLWYSGGMIGIFLKLTKLFKMDQ